MGEAYLAQVKFLGVDDNSFNRAMINRILRQFGAAEVFEAADGAEVIVAIKSLRPDIIITDWMMSSKLRIKSAPMFA